MRGFSVLGITLFVVNFTQVDSTCPTATEWCNPRRGTVSLRSVPSPVTTPIGTCVQRGQDVAGRALLTATGRTHSCKKVCHHSTRSVSAGSIWVMRLAGR